MHLRWEGIYLSLQIGSVYRNVIDMIITEEGLSRIGYDDIDYNVINK